MEFYLKRKKSSDVAVGGIESADGALGSGKMDLIESAGVVEALSVFLCRSRGRMNEKKLSKSRLNMMPTPCVVNALLK